MISLLLQDKTDLIKKLSRVCKRTGVAFTQVEGQTIITKTVYREVENEYTGKVDVTAFEVAQAFDRYTLDGFPGVQGFEFVCRIEHTEAGNIIAGPGTVEGWKEAKPTCDHCSKPRNRKDTFVLRNTDTNEIVRVGRNCLADFLRTDPTSLVKVADLFGLVREACEEGFGSGGSWDPEPLHFVACACVAIEVDGFRKTDWDRSTVSSARFLAGPRPKGEAEPAWRAGQPKAHHIEKAAAILEWVKTTDTTSTYMHNLSIAAALPGVTRRTGGLMASAPQAHAKFIGENLRKAAMPPSSWVAQPGDKISRVATVIAVRTVESYYGTKVLFNMRTDDGCDLIWWCSGAAPRKADHAPLDSGDRISIKGTVKSLDEYKGRKQTTLTRCKVEFIGPVSDA